MKITETAKKTLDGILKLFASGNVPKALALTIIPPLNVPCSKWSFNNRLLTILADTEDARGINQWKEVGRWPKKGSHAFYILAPMIGKKKNKDDEVEQFTYGFRAVPVFRTEDTEGKELNYKPVELPKPPPFSNLAMAWGIKVEWKRSNANYFGAYSPSQKKITMCTHNEQVFFHELAHVAHEKVVGQLKPGQDKRQEIVAELTAATLAQLFGKEVDYGHSYQYINHYVGDNNKVHTECLAVLSEVEKCLNLILNYKQVTEKQTAKAA